MTPHQEFRTTRDFFSGVFWGFVSAVCLAAFVLWVIK